MYCGLVFVVGFFLTHPPQKKLDPRRYHDASAVWKTYTLSCGGNSSYMGTEQLFKHNITNRAFSHLTLLSVSVLQLHRAWCSLLIMTSENGNAQDDLVCFAQVSLSSCGHISLWVHSRIKTHIPETDLSISMASCNAILCRMAHHASEVMVSTFGLHRIYRKPSRVKNVTLIISIVWGFFCLFICLFFFKQSFKRIT